jgi:DNA-binding NarL/FixJ family response regulator
MKSNRVRRGVLVSGSRFFLGGVRKVLEEADWIRIPAEVSNPEEIEERLTEIKPDFLFLDNRILRLDVKRLLNSISERSPSTRIILLEDRIEENGFNLPNVTYITKETGSLELVETIRSEIKESQTKKPAPGRAKHRLTRMELKVIELIASSYKNREIANKLSISEKTVKAHLTSIFKKLGLQNRYQLQLTVYKRARSDKTSSLSNPG